MGPVSRRSAIARLTVALVVLIAGTGHAAEAAGGFGLRMAVPTEAVAVVDPESDDLRIGFQIGVRNIQDGTVRIEAVEVRETSGDRVWTFDESALADAGSLSLTSDGEMIVPALGDWQYQVGVTVSAGAMPEALETRIRVSSRQGGTSLSSWLLMGETLVRQGSRAGSTRIQTLD